MEIICDIMVCFLQVKAALYAAACFCELSDDFASVVVEILVKLVSSSQTELGVRLAGVQVFAKMGCSSSLAHRVYKVSYLI